MRILITGGSGLLGKALIETRKDGHHIAATYIGNYTMQDADSIRYEKLDIRNREGHDLLFKEFRPDATIHTAGIGSPDYAEQHREESWDINIGGTRNILLCCEKYDSRLIFISSNGIYDGENAPYNEEDKANPINYYGELKLKGEELLATARIPYAIVRPILMYGWNHPFERSNIVTYALNSLEKDSVVHVYDDVFTTPLFSVVCAKVIWKIIQDERFEVFNIAGAERVSVYQMIRKLAAVFELNKDLVHPVQQGFFNELVRRPTDTSYRTDKMQDILGILSLTLQEGFEEMKMSRLS